MTQYKNQYVSTIPTKRYELNYIIWFLEKQTPLDLIENFLPENTNGTRSHMHTIKDTNNALGNTFYRPQHVYKQIQDGRMKDFSLCCIPRTDLDKCSDQWSKHFGIKLSAKKYASRFNQSTDEPMWTEQLWWTVISHLSEKFIDSLTWTRKIKLGKLIKASTIQCNGNSWASGAIIE